MHALFARRLAAVLLSWVAVTAHAQVRHEIAFPDVPGYLTLKGDFHIHTVFSDGLVWPTVRVDEAWRLGLDAMALTDHIEYKPFRADVSADHNRPYEVAARRAREHNLLFIRGAEITRDTPPGHYNAIFLNDITPLETDDFVEAVERANAQGGFVFWNHHAWKGSELGRWMEVHNLLYEKRWLHGMEVANGTNYYPEAHQWCLDRGLTMLGNSDIHQPDLTERMTSDRHRTITLVFAAERTTEALREALVAGSTAVWAGNRMIGRREFLEPLFYASIEVQPPHALIGNAAWFCVKNHSAMDLRLERAGEAGPATITLPAHTTTLLRVPVARPDKALELSYTATGFLISPETGLPVTLTVPVATAMDVLAGKRPHVRVAPATGAIRVNGDLDEPAWQAAIEMGPLHLTTLDASPSVDTRVWVTYDRDALYLAMHCLEPAMDGLRMDARSSGDDWWEDDVVELFIDADADRATYHHFAMTAGGVRYEGQGRDGSWDGAWEGSASLSPDGWTVEWAVPWTTLGCSAPQSDTGMGLQVTRSRPRSAEVMQWSPTAGWHNHLPSMFGSLAFDNAGE